MAHGTAHDEIAAGIPLTVVLCGPVCAGKTTIAQLLATRLDAVVVAARDAIARAAGAEQLDRRALIRVGARLEAEHPGGWLADAVDASARGARNVIVDSARTMAQLKALSERSGLTVRVYLRASRGTRERRFARRAPTVVGESNIQDIYATWVEQEVEGLAHACDLVVETSATTPAAATELITTFLRDQSP